MSDFKYKAHASKTLSHNHVNTKPWVAVVLRGDAKSIFPPNVIHKRMSNGTCATAKEAIEKAQKYIDANLRPSPAPLQE